jgi:hypothetical protein
VLKRQIRKRVGEHVLQRPRSEDRQLRVHRLHLPAHLFRNGSSIQFSS